MCFSHRHLNLMGQARGHKEAGLRKEVECRREKQKVDTDEMK